MANYEKFKHMYAANFHRLTDADGEQFWAEFVQECDGEILKDALERLADVATLQKEQGKIVTAPKLADIKNQYWRMKRQAEEKERAALLGKTSCGYCDGCGDVLVLMHKHVIVDPKNPPLAPYPALAWYAFPCKCDIGYSRTSEQECPKHQREKAVKYCIPWILEIKGERVGGDVLAWKIIWDCERKYTEQAKLNEVLN